MSSVYEINASFITMKLDLLERQKNNFCDQVNKILKDGRAWLDDKGKSLKSFEEVSKMIDQMIFCLESKDLPTSDSSDSEKPASQEETLPLEGASAPGQTQPSSTIRENLTTAEPTHQIHHSVVGHETVPVYVKNILSRLDVMDIAVSSLKVSTEKISTTQTEVQTQIENIKQNQSLMEEKQTKQLADMEKKVKKMGKHSEGMKQQEKRIVCLEKEVETVKERENKLSVLESEIQTMKKQEKTVNSLENQMLAVTSQLHDLEEKTFRKISNVEKQVEVNTDMVYHSKSRTESLSAKTDAMDSTVQDLSNRMGENKALIDRLLTSHDEDHQKLENLEQKTRNLTRKVNKNQKTFEEKLEEVKTEYKMVCHMVANRLLPLERLRTILNQKIKGREENVKKLYDVSDKVTDLEQKFTDLENRVSTTVIGFTAYFPAGFTPVPDKDNKLSSFTDVHCNFGNHFDSATGIFTTPINGVYAVYCSVYQWADGGVDVNVVHKANLGSNNTRVKRVCAAGTRVQKTSGSGFGLIDMRDGDTLHVEVVTKEGNANLTRYSSFSCFKIN